MNAPDPGPDVWIRRNVTVGATHSGDPVIGNPVPILTGAIMVGGITAHALRAVAVPSSGTVDAARPDTLSRRL